MPARFLDKPKTYRGVSYASRYELGGSLDDLKLVARKLDSDAEVVEVPQLGVAVVRYLYVPDHAQARTEYEVVEVGNWLVYSETFDLLYDSDPETFEREHEHA